MCATEVEQRAEALLAELKVTRPSVDPAAIARALGIDVRMAIFKDPRIGGMLTTVNNQRCIYVNRTDPATRIRLTIAHELGHEKLHLEGNDEAIDYYTRIHFGEMSPSESNTEEEANAFAVALLMPRPLVTKCVDMLKGSIREVATLFQVPEQAMSARVAMLGLGP